MGQRKPRKTNRLKISAQSRLHLTLLAMHNGEYRINGGLGFAIADPSCELTFTDATDFAVNDQRHNALTEDELERLIALLRVEQKRSGFDVAVEITINGNMRPHSGFGSGTAITLACLESLHRLNGSMPSTEELVAASGRGGTSGVGIHSYFSGGCVFDLGRATNNDIHTPSHQTMASRLPLLLNQQPMPDWDIGICIPLAIPHKSQAEERAFFDRTCPLSAEAVYETMYHTLFGLYAAIREADRTTFCRALRTVQSCAWKKAERLEYGTALIEIEQELYSAGCDAVGMSSLGPSLFFLADNVAEIVNQMRISRHNCEWLLTHPANCGRKLTND